MSKKRVVPERLQAVQDTQLPFGRLKTFDERQHLEGPRHEIDTRIDCDVDNIFG